jgi:hypothetical protein
MIREIILAIFRILTYCLFEQTSNTNEAAMLANLPTAILDTILAHLATLFPSGAGGDSTAARQAALRMVAEYNPQTVGELRLAALIVSFSLHALVALGQAANPDLPLTRVLRLRGSAVSLSRESDKAQRRLDQCQQARQDAAANPKTRPELALPASPQPEPKTQQAANPIQVTSTIPATAEPAVPTRSQPYNRAEDDARIAASVKRAEAFVAARNAAQASAGQDPATATRIGAS